jgi:gluconate 2-dehydrogenase gamma chain
MAGQGLERRDVLRYMGIAAVASTFPGFRRWVFASAVPDAMGARDAEASYKPLFFSQQQFGLIEHLTEMILPADDTPGAKAAGVAEFIDFMLANRAPVILQHSPRTTQDTLALGSEIQEQFTLGLSWLNAHARGTFGRDFIDCSAQQQNSLLEELAYKAKFRPNTDAGREFFELMRAYTVVGFYTTRIGLQSLGYPGLRMFWPGMPGCPHPGDPEHAYLREASDAKGNVAGLQTREAYGWR